MRAQGSRAGRGILARGTAATAGRWRSIPRAPVDLELHQVGETVGHRSIFPSPLRLLQTGPARPVANTLDRNSQSSSTSRQMLVSCMANPEVDSALVGFFAAAISEYVDANQPRPQRLPGNSRRAIPRNWAYLVLTRVGFHAVQNFLKVLLRDVIGRRHIGQPR